MLFRTTPGGLGDIGGFDIISITDTLFKTFLSTTQAGVPRADTLYFRVVK